MKNFFTAQTTTSYPDGSTGRVLCFVHPSHAVVMSLGITGGKADTQFRFRVELRSRIKTDTMVRLADLRNVDDVAYAEWSNGTVLAIASKALHDEVTASDSSIFVTGDLAERNPRAEIWLVAASSRSEALSKIRKLRKDQDVETTAKTYWESWMRRGILPTFSNDNPKAAAYLESYERNLYSVKAATLNGQIPADITGQFVTHGMPQLYPRDAMMCARVLLLTGHPEEARQVILFWTSPQLPKKAPGEWYARYDAHGKPVDAGSGARFDEPEWDANGYFIHLLERFHQSKQEWLTDRAFFYQTADFLVHHIGQNGLLEEGGIVEWTGYLPATNMICAAALRTAAKLAEEFGDKARSKIYADASQRITPALPKMFDSSRQTYADVRFSTRKGPKGESLPGRTHEKTYLWDTTANVGVVWGYPNHREIELSNLFYAKNTVKLDGGLQYFGTTDPKLAAYGHAVFFFTTAAASQYQSIRKDKPAAQSFIDWMMHNSNSYGLMPERINLDGTVSPASPLSWCSAEFVAAMLLWSELLPPLAPSGALARAGPN